MSVSDLDSLASMCLGYLVVILGKTPGPTDRSSKTSKWLVGTLQPADTLCIVCCTRNDQSGSGVQAGWERRAAS